MVNFIKNKDVDYFKEINKQCLVCKIQQPLDNFYKRVSGIPHQECKKCYSARGKVYRSKNSEKIKESAKLRYAINKEKINKRSKIYRDNNKEKIKAQSRAHYEANKEKIIAHNKIYREQHKESWDAYFKSYVLINEKTLKEKRKIYRVGRRKEKNDYEKFKRQTDPEYKLRVYLRARINKAIRCNYKNGHRSGSAVSDLGCSIEQLKEHLGKQFVAGMSWDNWGNKDNCWSIDHIKPLSSFDLTNREQFLEACNYKNLQPLWHLDNLKKHDKYYA